MTYTQALKQLDACKTAGMQMGLARMEAVLSRLGNPQRYLRTVHIAGTNGKGSTARMIQSIATAAGIRTALYASPAVTGLRDTITIDGEAISEARFAALTEEVLTAAAHVPAIHLSAFELVTALTLCYFQQENAALCVIECGLGGRDDATNVLPPPLVAVLTPVALDHTALLGGTIGEIAANKCGIFKAGGMPPCTVVTAPGQPDDALEVVMATASRLGLTVRLPNAAAAPVVHEELGRLTFRCDGEMYALPLMGVFQRDNALTAMETVRVLRERGFAIADEAIRDGLAGAGMPCRQEVLHTVLPVIVDGAHNPHGVQALAATLRRVLPEAVKGKRLVMVMGMLGDKDVQACVSLLAPLCDHVVCCTPADTPRPPLPAAQLADYVRACGTEATVCETPADALARARTYCHAASCGEPVPLLIAGSFYVASALRPLLLGNV